MSSLPFQTLNLPASCTAPAANSTSFELKPDVPTDIWRKPGPPEISTFNAPIIYKKIKLSQFKRARVTVSAPWKTLYDQGGLVLVLPREGNGAEGKWLKTGIEFYNNQAYVSTVTKDNWADWSLSPSGVVDGTSAKSKQVTLEMERNEKEGTLWVYAVLPGASGKQGEERAPLREVTWLLSEKDQDVWVGIYAAKPTEDKPEQAEEGELKVEFEGWQLDLMD